MSHYFFLFKIASLMQLASFHYQSFTFLNFSSKRMMDISEKLLNTIFYRLLQPLACREDSFILNLKVSGSQTNGMPICWKIVFPFF